MEVFNQLPAKQSLKKATNEIIKTLLIKKSNFYQRAVLAFIMSIFALFIGIMGGFWFNTIVLIAAIITAIEFTTMIHSKQINNVDSVVDYEIANLKKIVLPYIIIPAISLIFIRDSIQGRSIMIWLILNIAAVDTASYVVGNLIGKTKLYPSISPNKTIEGALGGIVAATIITVILFPIMTILNTFSSGGFRFYQMICLSLCVSVLSIIGDLFESYIKRKCGVKDSGSILLSHGGVMDRVDSLTFVAPLVAVMVIIKKGIFF